jgi:hypothetical protein
LQLQIGQLSCLKQSALAGSAYQNITWLWGTREMGHTPELAENVYLAGILPNLESNDELEGQPAEIVENSRTTDKGIESNTLA